MAAGNGSSWINSITAVSTTVAATLLVGFFGTFQDLAKNAPLIANHMQTTSSKLVEIESKQMEHTVLLAGLAKDYTSRDTMRAALEKIDGEIRDLQVKQAVLQQALDKFNHTARR